MQQSSKRRRLKRILLILSIIFLVGLLFPGSYKMPVQGATRKSYAQDSYWFYPWGKSVTHKGVDIFAKKGTDVHSATPGIVLFTGQLSLGGNVVFVLGPKWRLHYYAHLDSIETSALSLVNTSTTIGRVGATGNAAGKPPHLHYSINTMIPYVWQIDGSIQGWQKTFYLNPITYLNDSF